MWFYRYIEQLTFVCVAQCLRSFGKTENFMKIHTQCTENDGKLNTSLTRDNVRVVIGKYGTFNMVEAQIKVNFSWSKIMKIPYILFYSRFFECN